MRMLALLLSLLAAASGAPLHPTPVITIKGLQSLKFQETGEREWVSGFAQGSPGGEFYAFLDYQGNHWGLPQSARLTGTTIDQTYAWGTAQVTFTVLGDQTLEIKGLLTNQTTADLPNVDLNFCKIAFPTADKGVPPTITTWQTPGYWPWNGSNADIPCYFAYSDVGGWPGTMMAGQENWGNNAFYARGYTLKAGQSVNFKFHLNFFSTQAELGPVQANANQVFATKYPHFHWTEDLRSIGQVYFVTSEGQSGWHNNHQKWAKNPRGWLGDPNLDINDKPTFKARMEGFCRQCVANADSIGGLRGFVIWDIEGQQYEHGPCVYVGHPSKMPELAPEMNEIADDLMAILEDGGKYQIGFCLRQQQFAVKDPPDPEGPFWLRKWDQPDGDASRQDLEFEITASRQRWGTEHVTMYYVDSNDGNEVHNYESLAREFPQLLIYPESFYVVSRMYASWPQYQTARPQDYVRNGPRTQAKYTDVYPAAQSVINLADYPPPSVDFETAVTEVETGMLHGDIEQIRIWWLGGPEPPVLKEATKRATAAGWPHQHKPKPTPTPGPTATPTPTPTPTATPTPSPTPVPTPSPSVSPTPSLSYSQWLDQLAQWIKEHPAVPNK